MKPSRVVKPLLIEAATCRFTASAASSSFLFHSGVGSVAGALLAAHSSLDDGRNVLLKEDCNASYYSNYSVKVFNFSKQRVLNTS